MANKRVDCDGHVMEVTDELISFVGEPFKTTGHMNPRRVLPSLDRFHTPRLEERKPGTFDPSVGPEKWLQFLDKTGLESSVLFPTEGLAYGQVAFPPWAIAYAKAYNDLAAREVFEIQFPAQGYCVDSHARRSGCGHGTAARRHRTGHGRRNVAVKRSKPALECAAFLACL